MNLAPIILDHYFVTELSIIARQSYNPEKEIHARLEEFEAECRLHPIDNQDNQDLWQLELEVSQQSAPESNFPYEFRIVVIGFFQCMLEEQNQEERYRVIKINGTSMLYGIVREIIRANTGRGPWDAVMIPTISFYEPRDKGSVDPE